MSIPLGQSLLIPKTCPKIDELARSQKAPVIVIPLKTGKINCLWTSAFEEVTDGLGDFQRGHQDLRSWSINIAISDIENNDNKPGHA